MKKYINTDKIPALIIIGFIVGIWEYSVRVGIVKAYILPTPSSVIYQLFYDYQNLINSSLITIKEAGIGFVLAILFALILGMIMDFIPFVKKGLYPLLVVSQTVPIIVLAPLFGLWFGFGELPKIIIVVLVCFFPIIISFNDGLENVEVDMINLVKGMGANKYKIFRFIKIPYALAAMFSGIRISATYAIMGAVIGEWLGGSGGLGVYIMRMRHSYRLDKMFAAILIIIILSILLFKCIDFLQGLLMPWTEGEKK